MEPPLEVAETPGADSEQGACPACGDDAPSEGPNSRITAVFLQLLPRIASFLPRNEVACVLRLLCKAAAGHLRGPQHVTVHLSEPVPPAEFEWRWCGPQSLRNMTRQQRQQLEELTACSGVFLNLEALAARGDMPVLSRPTSQWSPLLQAAAGSGCLDMCRWLHEQQGVPLSPNSLLRAAAAGGHTGVCEWLLESGCGQASHAASGAALYHGHVGLAERLLHLWQHAEPLPYEAACWVVLDAAHGCDLATLQRLHDEHVASRGWELSNGSGAECVAAAAGSPTPDWAAKVEWLKGLVFGGAEQFTCYVGLDCSDAAARLAWLHARGYKLSFHDGASAARAGNAEALRYVLADGDRLEPGDLRFLMRDACAGGSLEAVQMVLDAGGRLDARAVEAARDVQLHIVAWAAEQLGERAVLTARLFCTAARSTNLPLLRWLHERNCPSNSKAFVGAAAAGSEEALEWLAEHGYPMGVSGKAYVKAAESHDLLTLRCLARLGCPFAPDGLTFENAACKVARQAEFDGRPLQWLLDAGCPVDWGALFRRLHEQGAGSAAREWLEQQRQQRGHILPPQ